MDAWNDEPRVRPIPIDDDPSSEPESVPRVEHKDGGEPPKHPWLPITLAGAAVAIVLGSVAVFGALHDQDPPPSDAAYTEDTTPDDVFSPPVTAAVSLQESVPGLTDRLTLVANSPTGPVALLWDPSFILPKAVPVAFFDPQDPPEDQRLALRTATFDAGGNFVAVTGIPGGESREVVRVGTPTDISSISLDGATSFVWHATDVAHLAWIALNSGGQPTLYTARVNPLSNVLMDQKEVAPLTASTTRIVRWDASGFVLNTGLGEIVALTTTGDVLWAALGKAITASASTILVSEMGARPHLLESVSVVDRSGTPIREWFEEDAKDDLLGRTVRMSRNTDLVARIDIRQDRTRIEMNGPGFVTAKVIHYNDDIEPIDFTSNDKYLVFRADGTNDLIFFNWSVGSIHVLDVPDQYGVVGLDLG